MATFHLYFMIVLSEIWVYPIKGLGGIPLQQAFVQPRGLRHDRRWMLVDNQGRFVSQRESASLTQLLTNFEDEATLLVRHRERPDSALRIPLYPETKGLDVADVSIWDDKLQACIMPAPIGEWFSDQLGMSLRLAYMGEGHVRPTDRNYAPEGQEVSFADGYPFLIIGQSALDELNAKLAVPIPMNRFRPNFVAVGTQPHEEDTWSDFYIGGLPFRGVKPCARCLVPTTDQITGQRGAEPLKTLATYRTQGHKILFGQNVIWMGDAAGGVVKVGQDILMVNVKC